MTRPITSYDLRLHAFPVRAAEYPFGDLEPWFIGHPRKSTTPERLSAIRYQASGARHFAGHLRDGLRACAPSLPRASSLEEGGPPDIVFSSPQLWKTLNTTIDPRFADWISLVVIARLDPVSLGERTFQVRLHQGPAIRLTPSQLSRAMTVMALESLNPPTIEHGRVKPPGIGDGHYQLARYLSHLLGTQTHLYFARDFDPLLLPHAAHDYRSLLAHPHIYQAPVGRRGDRTRRPTPHEDLYIEARSGLRRYRTILESSLKIRRDMPDAI